LPVRTDTTAARATLARRLQRQAEWCDSLGSPFYSKLLRRTAADLDHEGAAWGMLRGFEVEDGAAALALRLMGGVHRLVLTGELPALDKHYPSVGGDGDAEAAWPPFHQALSEASDRVREVLPHGCQTNEVGRSAALLGGFLEVSARTGLPLRLLEIGTSAGLNLRWDRYRYEAAGRGWGDPDSPVTFDGYFDVPPRFDRSAAVAERRGCDLNPIDPTSDDGSLTLRSFIWADQADRFHLLEAAIEVARQVPARIEQIDAAAFLERELSTVRPGTATVVFHSVFIQYLGDEGRRRIAAAIDGAAARATPDAPIAYLRMEPADTTFEIRLDEQLLGTARAHGKDVRWLVS
jgi:hypothetical protein